MGDRSHKLIGKADRALGSRIGITLALTAVVLLGAGRSPAQQGFEGTKFRNGSAEANGIRLHYRIGGSGPPLLLIHGFTGTGAWWEPLLNTFGAHHTTIIPDLPGHGRSESRDGPYRYSVVANDLHALLDHLKINKVRAVGFSAGGEIALHMALQQPKRIEAMALVGAAHELPEAAISILRGFPDLEDNPLAYREYWLRIHPGGKPQVRSLLAAMRGLADVPDNMVGEELLGLIEAPTLLVVGDRDPWVSLEIALRAFRALPEAALWVVPGQEHLAVWPDWGGSGPAGEIFPRVVLDFLQNAVGERTGSD